MPELGPSGSVRGAVSNHRPYRDHRWSVAQLSVRCRKADMSYRHLHGARRGYGVGWSGPEIEGQMMR